MDFQRLKITLFASYSRGWCVAFLTFGLLASCPAWGQEVYPPHWFQDMENDSLELIVHWPEGQVAPLQVGKDGPRVLSSSLAPNSEYAYLLLSLKDFAEADFELHLKAASGSRTIRYELREAHPHEPQGLSPADALYLITPDRFANGDTSNDRIAGFQEKSYGRQAPYGRHGGDLAGILAHLDYLDKLGFTALWISPLLTNDQPVESYHGYAITDHFQIDPRMGTGQQYQELVEALHRRDMKIVMDVVYNHVGDRHQFFRNPPDSGFFNFWEGYKQTQYRASTLMDPHAAQSDKQIFSRGWFDRHMPDLNQGHPQLARYLIQQSLWWILEYGLDAFRIDTYAYPDQQFMSRLARRIHAERPSFFLFGELWVHMPEIQSYFSHPNARNPIASDLDGLTDFTTYYAFQEALKETQSWTGGIARLYYRLAADHLYTRPDSLITFLDNHDLARIYGSLGQDTAKLRLALGMLYTLRGIPCTYYGTEVLMAETDHHGLIREDFPGGWPGDSINLFDPSQHRGAQAHIWQYMQKLLHWRRNSSAITEGEFTHFIPRDEVYAYLRHSSRDTVLVLVNTHTGESRSINLQRFEELWSLHTSARLVPSGRPFRKKQIELPPLSIRILEKR